MKGVRLSHNFSDHVHKGLVHKGVVNENCSRKRHFGALGLEAYFDCLKRINKGYDEKMIGCKVCEIFSFCNFSC